MPAVALEPRTGFAEAVRPSGELRGIVSTLGAGQLEFGSIEQAAMERLRSHGWAPDYVAIRRQPDLGPPALGEPLVVLAAARLGTTRLIDNFEVTNRS